MSGALFGGLFGIPALRGGASLTLFGAPTFAAGAAGVALGNLLAPAVYTAFSKVAGSAKLACSAGGALTTSAATAVGDVLSARFRAATADGSRAIEETFTFTATGVAQASGGYDFSTPDDSAFL